jgi:MerR family transcriptional regulator/heat shock protein HspR
MIFRISKFAALAGVHPQTVRNFERRGLIHPQRDRNNYRVFTGDDLKKVKEIILPGSKGLRDQQNISKNHMGD